MHGTETYIIIKSKMKSQNTWFFDFVIIQLFHLQNLKNKWINKIMFVIHYTAWYTLYDFYFHFMAPPRLAEIIIRKSPSLQDYKMSNLHNYIQKREIWGDSTGFREFYYSTFVFFFIPFEKWSRHFACTINDIFNLNGERLFT